MKKIVFISILCIFSLVSCTSRMLRPTITGIIVDYENRPIANCKVGETVTDNEGKFVLPEIRYNKFLFSDFFQMEGTPLFISEIIEKEGFESEEIYMFSSYGGGNSEGTKFEMDTVHLKKQDAKFNRDWLLNQKWKLSANKAFDTLYMIRDGFFNGWNTKKCQDFYLKYESYEDNYLDSSGPNNLPDSVIKRFITIAFKEENQFNLQRITIFGNKNGDTSNEYYDKIKNDTTLVNGIWMLEDETLRFKLSEPSLNQINKTFDIVDMHLNYFSLTACK
jgi:hypothetical protein